MTDIRYFFISLVAAITIEPLPLQPGVDIPIVHVQSRGETLTAIVDTGGASETQAGRSSDFQTYYSGLPITAALGADYLRDHAVSAGSTNGTPRAVPLDVRTAGKLTIAMVTCTIGGQTYRMLFDTAALAWRESDSEHRAPKAVIFLSRPAFAALTAARPEWPVASDHYQLVTESGLFVTARSLVAPSVECGGYSSAAQTIVERADPTTYQRLKQGVGVDIQGDASLSAFSSSGITVDFPNARLLLYL